MSRYMLEVRTGEETHRTVAVPEDEPTTLGRGAENDVVLPQRLVSLRHAVIEPGPAGPVLRDTGSTNGTYVNGERLEGPRPLEPGDRIVMGGVKLVLRVRESTSEACVTFLDEGMDTQQIFARIDAANRNLQVLHEMGSLLLEVKDEAELSARLLDLVFDVVPADRGSVILRTPEGSLESRAARARSEHRGDLAVSRTILAKTVEEGVSLLTADAGRDERFRGEESVIVQGVRAAMCAPIRGKKEVLGALYVDTELRTGAFRKENLELLTTLGIQGGIAVENLRLLERSLRAERLAAIGGVVAGLGHDIRNILAALRGGAYVMDMVVAESEDPDLAEAWDIVRGGTDTIAELVEDMVSYSKERRPELRPTDLNALVARVAARFAPRAEAAGAEVRTELEADLPEVPLEASALDRVLSNLVTNALDAIGEAGTTVRLGTSRSGEEVEVAVADDGPGIPPEHRERIFDLLFSTKGSKGTGFGLAVTKKIVAEHGGTVTVDTEPGEGATFRIRLPLRRPPED